MKYPKAYEETFELFKEGRFSNDLLVSTLFYDIAKQEMETNYRYAMVLAFLERFEGDVDIDYAIRELKEIMGDEDNHDTRAKKVAERFSGVKEASE